MIAAVIGEVSCHLIHDLIALHYINKHHGHFEPELRLRAIFISTPFMVVGIVLLGFALENAYHYLLASLGWGLYVFGIMVTTVAINAYGLDSYPEGSGEVAAWINMARTTGGFIVSYFQVEWANAMGVKNSFVVQASIIAGAFIIPVCLVIWGKALRETSGPLGFKTA